MDREKIIEAAWDASNSRYADENGMGCADAYAEGYSDAAEQLAAVTKELAAANRGAKTNALVNQGLVKRLAQVTAERDELTAVLDSARIIWVGEWQAVYIGINGGISAQIIEHYKKPFVQKDGFKTIADAVRWIKGENQ